MALGAWFPLAVAAFVLCCEPPLPSGEIAEVPFELHQQHLVVTKASIGTLSDLNVLIDTGTIPSVVDHRIARKLRLRAGASMMTAFGQRMPTHAAVLDGFRIGSFSSGPVPASLSDLSYLAGVRIDAIVGLDVLVRTNFAIDYRARVLKLAATPPVDTTAALDVSWPFVTVRMAVEGRHVRLLVDTGSRDLVLFTERAAAVLSNLPWRGDKTVQYASGPAQLRRLDLRQVSLGADKWNIFRAWALDRELDGYPPDIDGVLGVTALGCHRVRFDFDRGELGWSR